MLRLRRPGLEALFLIVFFILETVGSVELDEDANESGDNAAKDHNDCGKSELVDHFDACQHYQADDD